MDAHLSGHGCGNQSHRHATRETRSTHHLREVGGPPGLPFLVDVGARDRALSPASSVVSAAHPSLARLPPAPAHGPSRTPTAPREEGPLPPVAPAPKITPSCRPFRVGQHSNSHNSESRPAQPHSLGEPFTVAPAENLARRTRPFRSWAPVLARHAARSRRAAPTPSAASGLTVKCRVTQSPAGRKDPVSTVFSAR